MQIGWMMEGLVIDPFDSNHWLYGTGETIYGGHDLLKWDSATRNVTLKSLADGVEETSVQGLISPPSGPPLISAIGDVDGMQPIVLSMIYELINYSSKVLCIPIWMLRRRSRGRIPRIRALRISTTLATSRPTSSVLARPPMVLKANRLLSPPTPETPGTRSYQVAAPQR